MGAKYKRQKDGRYQTRVWDGTYNSDGAKHRVTLYSSKSSKDLERKVQKYVESVDNGEVSSSSDVLFVDYARKWLVTYKSVRERGTQIMYENIIEKHLIALESVKLSELRRLHFQGVINAALDKPRTCQQIGITFRQIVKSAVADRFISMAAAESICSGVQLPRYVPTEKRGLTEQEKDAIKNADFTDKERAFVYILYGCGLRRGEALALTVFDVCLERAELSVCKSLAYEGNEPYIKGTKSANGARTVPLPGFAASHLKNYMRGLDGTTLFPMSDGRQMTKSSYRKMWESIVRKMNEAAGGTKQFPVITDLTAHVFRHNYCSNLCYQMPDISIKKIAQLLGDTEKMVLDVYNHVLEEKENVNAVVNEALAL